MVAGSSCTEIGDNVPVTVRYDEQLGIVRSLVTGETSPEDVRMETIQLAKVAGEHDDCRQFLSGFRPSIIQFSFLDVYRLKQLQENQGLTRLVRMAVLPPPGDRGRELAEFIEAVSTIQAWTAGPFNSEEAALARLFERSEPAQN